MKKLVMFALAAALSFGSAVPAFAVGPHHRSGQCFDYTEVCHRMAQNLITPGLQSLNERLGAVLGMCAYPLNPNGQGVGAGQQVDTYATSPSLCANGACGMYLDADADGICDYHGVNCTNMGGNYVDANGDGVCDNYGSGYSNGNGANGTNAGYGRHHGGGHHGGWRR